MGIIKDEKIILINFFEEIIEKLETEIEILSLRPKLIKTNDDYFKGDFDFIINKKEYPKVLRIIYCKAKESGINFELKQRFKNKNLFIFFITNKNKLSLKIEFWTAIEFTHKGIKKNYSNEKVFKSISSGIVDKTDLLIFLYITHLYHKKKDINSLENRYRFEIFFRNSNNVTDATRLLKKIKVGPKSIEEVNKSAIDILKSYGITPTPTIQLKFKSLIHKVKFKCLYIKKIIPIVGPDGVGKGVVTNESLKSLRNVSSYRFKKLYRLNKIYSLRLKLLFNNTREPKNILDERILYYIFFTSLISFQNLKFSLKNNSILLDRYFPDYFASPIRHLNKGKVPKKAAFYKTILFLTPVPHKMIFMGCQNSSLIERKNELPLRSVKFMETIYIEFIEKKRLPEVLFISTENEITVSSNSMVNFIQ